MLRSAGRPIIRLVKTFKQILREFWIPFLVAVAWTVYTVWNSPAPARITSAIAIFGGAFFLVSWATGQVNRIRKQTHLDSNLKDIQTRLEGLLGQIESRTTEIVAQITGGQSFCYSRRPPASE